MATFTAALSTAAPTLLQMPASFRNVDSVTVSASGGNAAFSFVPAGMVSNSFLHAPLAGHCTAVTAALMSAATTPVDAGTILLGRANYKDPGWVSQWIRHVCTVDRVAK